MNKYISFCLCLLFIWSFSACGNDGQKKTVAIKKMSKTQKKVLSSPKSKQADKGEWPYIKGDSDSDAEISSNLTAKNYVLIFDGSGSMGETSCGGGKRKISVAKEAVIDWAKSLPKGASLGLAAFYYNRWATLPLKSDNQTAFIAEIKKVSAGGRTPLTKAIQTAFASITSEGKKQLGYGEYTIVVVTDGIANNAFMLSSVVKKILAESPVTIHTIGFCIGKNHSLNQPGLTLYKSANNPEELKKGLSEVLAESDTFDETDFN